MRITPDHLKHREFRCPVEGDGLPEVLIVERLRRLAKAARQITRRERGGPGLQVWGGSAATIPRA
jgi:hypothetical protein